MTETPARQGATARDVLVHITDLHFWQVVLNPFQLMNKRMLGNANVLLRRRREFQTHLAEQFADMLRETGATSVFAGGDFTSTATSREFALAADFVGRLEDRGLKVFVVPGNHDVYTFESVRRKRFERHFRDYLPAEGYPCRVDLPGGTPMVLAPTVSANWLSSKGRITGAEAERTAELVAACPPGPVLVGAHYPVLHETHAYRTSPGRRLRKAELLRRALGASGRDVLYLSGHVHRFSYVRDTTYPLLRHVSTTALFMQRPDGAHPGGFSEVRVHKDGFTVFNHLYRGGWTRNEQKPHLETGTGENL